MPSELLHFPPAYTVVGLYRLLTDPSIRTPVLDKIKHASVRGGVVALAYAALSWKFLDWFIEKYILSGRRFLGIGSSRLVARSVKDDIQGLHAGGNVRVGVGRFSTDINAVFYAHMLILLPQISQILRFFVLKNLRIARSRAWALTVASRRKPAEFWSQHYVEEWAQPPVPPPTSFLGGTPKHQQPKWVRWILYWPVQFVIKHYILLKINPTLPLLFPFVIAGVRGVVTAEYLHQPYFDAKGMDQGTIWRWVEERMWAYKIFGFAAALLERIPILGLFLSISNRIGAAMWAFDLEKRQHLFANGFLKPLPPNETGFYGSGPWGDQGLDIQQAEKEIDARFSLRYQAERAAHAKSELQAEAEPETLAGATAGAKGVALPGTQAEKNQGGGVTAEKIAPPARIPAEQGYTAAQLGLGDTVHH